METGVQDEEARAKIVGWAGAPYVLQQESLAAVADLPKGEFTMPSVPDGEG